MFDGLLDIDWASMQHAYGSAEEVPALLTAMKSGDAHERGAALDRFYSAVFHQGSVYQCTAASVPFLLEMARDPATPDRARIVDLLVQIGESAAECGDELYLDWDGNPYGGPAAAAAMSENHALFSTLATDPDVRVRRAAIPALALFEDDGLRAVGRLRARYDAETAVAERLLVVRALAFLAQRIPSTADDVLAWFDALLAHDTAEPALLLDILALRALHPTVEPAPDTVSRAGELLSRIHDGDTVPAHPARTPNAGADTGHLAPQIADAFADLAQAAGEPSSTERSLADIHEALGARIGDRTALLDRQLRTSDLDLRLTALTTARAIMMSWRGDHGALILRVSEHLRADDPRERAAAADTLERCHAIAEPAREPLAEHLAAQHRCIGARAWADPDLLERRSHQNAVRALARLGDPRAVSDLLVALDSDVDTWRAIQVMGELASAADTLVEPLCAYLEYADLTASTFAMTANSALDALGRLGGEHARTHVTRILTDAIRDDNQDLTRAALSALSTLGPAAAPALPAVHALLEHSENHTRTAALTTLWAISRDHEPVLAPLRSILDDPANGDLSALTDLLADLGPAAAAAVPRLRAHLSDGNDWFGWNRVRSATALWHIAGEPEAPAVLDALLHGWKANEATAGHVLRTLHAMGSHAAPALPLLHAELAETRRVRELSTITADEELQHLCRDLITRLT
ncbi:HEAT repeat domain-containing protein [Nocardia sp. NPDC055321]